MFPNTFKGLVKDLRNIWNFFQTVQDIKDTLVNPPDERNFFVADFNKARAGSDSILHHHKKECPCRYAPDLPCYCRGKNQSEGLFAQDQVPSPAQEMKKTPVSDTALIDELLAEDSQPQMAEAHSKFVEEVKTKVLNEAGVPTPAADAAEAQVKKVL